MVGYVAFVFDCVSDTGRCGRILEHDEIGQRVREKTMKFSRPDFLV